MSNDDLNKIREAIINDPAQTDYNNQGWQPLFAVDEQSKILIIGQAPGIKTQEKNVVWKDLSGNRLRSWLGVNELTFYNTKIFGQMPMDFYFPGKAKTGDKPPRKDFAPKWHPKILAELKNLKLIILIGNYAQKYYLKNLAKQNLTQTVHAYKDYLPLYFPLPHPSPLNVRWFKQNPWFEDEVLPTLKHMVNQILEK